MLTVLPNSIVVVFLPTFLLNFIGIPVLLLADCVFLVSYSCCCFDT